MRRKSKTRALSLLLALVMVLGLLPGTAWAAEDSIVQIATAEELAAFRGRVNAGEKTLDALLTADIVLTEPWTPFNPADGYISSAYSGTFNGAGHTINGLNIQDGNTDGVGLFGTINGATIKNLNVSGSVSSSNSSFVGGIVGKTGGTAVIENCSFSGSVTSGKTGSSAGVGGIAGRVNAGTVTITGCANSANISGGVAGGILGYCTSRGNVIENCYNTGTISGSSRTGGIAGQAASTAEIKNCCTTQGNISGFGGTLTNCYDESNPPADVSMLGNAFTTDADGNIILAWQAGAAPAPSDPKITITGSSNLYMTNSGPQPAGSLTVCYQDMAAVPVEWDVVSGENVITLSSPESPDANNSTQTVAIRSPGKATVKATAGEYSDEIEVTVWPFVTTVEIDGDVAVGQTVKAKINILGGDELDYETFPVKVQWRYLTREDYSAANTGNYRDIPGATEREFKIPAGLMWDYLSFTYRYQNEDKAPNLKYQVSDKAPEQSDPQPAPPASIEDALKWYVMRPVCGTDTNVNTVLSDYLADKGFKDIEVSVKAMEEVYGGAGIAENGDITYFYADPNTAPAIKMGSYKVTFALSKGSETLEKEVPVILYWDVAKVQETMRQEISSKVAAAPDGPVAENLTLPKVVDNKRWTLISWQSSDPEVISISSENQSTPDTLFDPYVGVVKRGKTDQQVTLTATFTFQLTSDVTGGETPITLTGTYPVTVKALDSNQEEQIRAGLLARLDAGFAKKGLTDAATGEKLSPDENSVYTAANDIQLPTTRDFDVDGKYYPVTITTSNGAILTAPDVNNAARVEVYRPGPAQEDAEGTITVTLHDRDTSVTASREFKIKVPALTQEEIDGELALMERVKAAYFDGIKGGNDARNNVRTDLSPFFEVYEHNGELVWVRAASERTGRGIVPVPIEGWEELELWRLFQSSNPNVISHENLLVTRQAEAKAVTITSRLSSQTLGRYGELYLSDPVTYAQYAGLERLWYQEASTDASTQPEIRKMTRAAVPAAQAPADTIVVRGTKHPDSAVPVVETVDNVTFTLTGLDGAVWISTSFTGLDEASAVYDVFVKALGDDYTATRVKGTYIKAISGPKGSLSEKDFGENSGWMYQVNGRIPDVYMGACPLHSGDTIQVFYTRDAQKDDPNWNWSAGGNTSSGNHSSSGSSGGKTDRPNPQETAVEKAGQENTYTITLPKDSKGSKLVTIPNVKSGQLVVIVRSDGREEVIKKSILENDRAKFFLEQNASVKVVDYANPFEDVPASAWYASAVDFVAGRGLFAGVSQNDFAPDLPLSRGMLAAILFRLEDAERQTAQSRFPDVADGTWYTQGVIWAAENGIAGGYRDGRFGPNDRITREQLAVMLFRYAQLLNTSTGGRDSLIQFSDSASVSPWAQEAVAWAVDSGIISGLPDGRLAPTGTATRAEAAAMLQSFVRNILK